MVRYGQLGVRKWGARCSLPGMCPPICQPQAEVLNILMPSLKLPNWGAHTRGTFEKHAHFGGSCPPLQSLYVSQQLQALVICHFVLSSQICVYPPWPALHSQKRAVALQYNWRINAPPWSHAQNCSISPEPS